MHQTERNNSTSYHFHLNLQVNKLIMFEGRKYDIYNQLTNATVLMFFLFREGIEK
jgi:hypothetical protein